MSSLLNPLTTHAAGTTGYPFRRGVWMPGYVTPTVPTPLIAKPDHVRLSPTAQLQQPANTSGSVKVKSGDTLSQLLLDRGISIEEMFAKDKHGKTMIDRVAATNNLKNPDLIYPGQQLSLPSKDGEQAVEAGTAAKVYAAPAHVEKGPGTEIATGNSEPPRPGVLLFDQRQDGVHTTDDIEFSEHLQKAFAGDGDLNSDGKVDWVEHLRANSMRLGYQELFDRNKDGRIDAKELKESGAKVWTDNGDGFVSSSELSEIEPAMQLEVVKGKIEADPEYR